MFARNLFALGVLALAAVPALAQPRVGPTSRPAVSPYLNLVRPGSPPGLNYYDLVKPQLEFRRDILDLRQQVTSNQTVLTDLTAGGTGSIIPTTGHTTRFMDTGGFYPGLPGTTSRLNSSQGHTPARPRTPATGRR